MNTDNSARGEKIKPEKSSTLKAFINEGTFFSREEWMEHHHRHCELAGLGHKDILMLGDSILFGWQWPGRPKIWQKHFPELSCANLAMSGDYIQHLLWRIENNDLTSFTPDFVILLIGANNIDDYTEVEISKGIMKILNRVKQSCSGASIVLTGIFPRGQQADTPLRRKISRVNEMIMALDDGQKVFYHDPGRMLLEPDESMDRKMFYDFCHPNLEGYRRWAELLAEFIRRIQEQRH